MNFTNVFNLRQKRIFNWRRANIAKGNKRMIPVLSGTYYCTVYVARYYKNYGTLRCLCKINNSMRYILTQSTNKVCSIRHFKRITEILGENVIRFFNDHAG